MLCVKYILLYCILPISASIHFLISQKNQVLITKVLLLIKGYQLGPYRGNYIAPLFLWGAPLGCPPTPQVTREYLNPDLFSREDGARRTNKVAMHVGTGVSRLLASLVIAVAIGRNIRGGAQGTIARAI